MAADCYTQAPTHNHQHTALAARHSQPACKSRNTHEAGHTQTPRTIGLGLTDEAATRLRRRSPLPPPPASRAAGWARRAAGCARIASAMTRVKVSRRQKLLFGATYAQNSSKTTASNWSRTRDLHSHTPKLCTRQVWDVSNFKQRDNKQSKVHKFRTRDLAVFPPRASQRDSKLLCLHSITKQVARNQRRAARTITKAQPVTQREGAARQATHRAEEHDGLPTLHPAGAQSKT